MKRLLPVLMGFVLLLLSSTEGWSLHYCPGSPLTGSVSDVGSWNNCSGTHIFGPNTKMAGVKYVGKWKNGRPYGQGTQTFSAPSPHAGYNYVGEWRNGKRHGQGTATFSAPNKDAGFKYVGEFRNGKYNGQGIGTYADGRVLEGIWENDKFKYAQKVTPTVTARKSPISYSGVSGENLPPCLGQPTNRTWTNCHGSYHLSNGEKYAGELRNGKPHGQGTATFSAPHKEAGQKYVGEFRDGKEHGQGTYTFPRGAKNEFCCKYVGEWKNGIRSGPGIHTYADGRVQEGIWYNNIFQHAQKVTPTVTARKSPPPSPSANGKLYVGELRNGKAHGQGTLTYADGRVQEGIWYNNIFQHAQKVTPTVTARKSPPPSPSAAEIENERLSFISYSGVSGEILPPCSGQLTSWYWTNCHGSYHFSTGEKYVGEFRDGKQHGQGTLTYADGRVQEGIWYNNIFQHAQKTPKPKVDQQHLLRLARRTQEALQVLGLYSGRLDGIIGAKTRSAIQRWQKRNGYTGTGEVTEAQLTKLEQETITRPAEKKPEPTKLSATKVPKRPDDIAVIIANSNYKKLGKGIPNVTPAYNDAENIKRYFMKALGVREGNIIYLKDATKAQMTSVLGSQDDHRGRLFNWTKPNISKVYIYYAGHGAPAGDRGTTYLVPSDTDSQTVQLTGYPLKQLYRNLSKLPAISITVILEACFSGQSHSGHLSVRTSGISIQPKMPNVPNRLTVISAGAANQVASWEQDESQSLFTKYFLKAMSGDGDRKPYGNGDGKVSLKELKRYLDKEMTYLARRYYGRDQNAQITVDGRQVLVTN